MHRLARSELTDALAAEAVGLAFQPQIALADGAVVAREALARWTHPQRGPLSPSAFLPAFRHEGLSKRLARSLVAQAAHASASAPVWVNIDLADALDARFGLETRALLQEAGSDAQRMMLEINEDELASLGETGWGAVERLRACGLCLALDGRGAARIALDGRARALFSALKVGGPAMLAAARTLERTSIEAQVRRLGAAQAAGMITVAVGAETAEILPLLAAWGFDRAQGDAIAPACVLSADRAQVA
jgi:diguanylate cyclase